MRRARSVGAAVTVAVVLGGAAASPAGTLAPRVTVESQARKDHLLTIITANLVMSAGLNRALVDRALVGVERHLEWRLKAGQPVVLYPEVVISITRAALLHGWSGADVAGVLVDVLRCIDEGRSPEMTRRAAMVAITNNLKPAAVVTALGGGADPRE